MQRRNQTGRPAWPTPVCPARLTAAHVVVNPGKSGSCGYRSRATSPLVAAAADLLDLQDLEGPGSRVTASAKLGLALAPMSDTKEFWCPSPEAPQPPRGTPALPLPHCTQTSDHELPTSPTSKPRSRCGETLPCSQGQQMSG